MKNAVLRDHTRKVKVPPHRGNNPHSQSPPHKKLMKKIQGIQTNAIQIKNDFSLQEKPLQAEYQEEAQDFRVEIERRFQKSKMNREFRLPLHRDELSNSSSSEENSLSSLKYVTTYDLASQNNPRKSGKTLQRTHTYTASEHRDHNELTKATSYTNLHDVDDYSYEQPLEALISDKGSAAYQNLIKLLENQRMFSHNSTNLHTQQSDHPIPSTEKQHNFDAQAKTKEFLIPPTDIPVVSAHPQKKASENNRIMSAKPRVEQSDYNSTSSARTSAKNKRISSSREVPKKPINLDYSSTTRNETHQLSSSHERHTTVGTDGSHLKERPTSKLKKTLSYDKIQNAPNNKSLGNLSALGNSYSKAKLSQESLKKIYSNNILKSITPQYQNTKHQNPQLFSREGMFKSYNNDGVRPQAPLLNQVNSLGAMPSGVGNVKSPISALTSLYQRAQNEVITHKLSRVSDEQNRGTASGRTQHKKAHSTSKQFSNVNVSSSMLPTSKRYGTPKGFSKKIDTQSSELNSYASPEEILEKYSAISRPSLRAKPSQKDIMKGLHLKSPEATANEKVFNTYYDPSHQLQGIKKAEVKLVPETRNQTQSRESLSSKRTRHKTSEKFPLSSEKQTLSRTALEQHISNHMLNGSLFKDSSKESLIA